MPPDRPTDRSEPSADDALTLRPAVAADAPGIAAVHLAARRAAPMPPAVHTDAEVGAWLASRIGIDEVWVAVASGGPETEADEQVEVVAAYARWTATWLDDLYVDPAWSGRGIGSALLDLVKAQRPRGFGLWVFEVNAPARAFYAAHGLEEVLRTDGSDNEEHEPDLHLAWPGRVSP